MASSTTGFSPYKEHGGIILPKIYSHNFGYCLVFYQNLSIPHIWLAKSMTIFFYPNLTYQIFGMINFDHKSIKLGVFLEE